MRKSISALAILFGLGSARSGLAQDFYPQETESYILNYMVRAKDPTAATILSLAPGFGAGHFYCDDYVTGAIMLGGNVVGGLLLILGPQIDKEGGTLADVFLAFGGVIFAGFRIADAYLAPSSAAKYNRKLAKKLKIKSLVMEVPGRRRHQRARYAYGVALEAPLGP